MAERRAVRQWVQSPYGIFLNPGLDGSLKLEHATKFIISKLEYQLIVLILLRGSWEQLVCMRMVVRNCYTLLVPATSSGFFN